MSLRRLAPVSSRLNRDHPLAQYLAFAWHAGINVEAISGGVGVLDASTVRSAGPYGKHTKTNQNSFTPQGITFTGTKTVLAGNGQPGWTIIAVLNGWSSSSSGAGTNACVISGAVGEGGISIDSTGHVRVISNFTATGTSTGTIATNTPVVIAGTTQYGQTGNKIYINGALDTTFTDGGFNASMTPVSIGGVSGQASAGISVVQILVFNRRLTDDQIFRISKNPNQLWSNPLHRSAHALPTTTTPLAPSRLLTLSLGTATAGQTGANQTITAPGTALALALGNPSAGSGGASAITLAPGQAQMLPTSAPNLALVGYVNKNPTSGGNNRLMGDWSSIAYDEAARYVLIWGIGHDDGSENYMLAYDLLNRSMSMIRTGDTYVGIAPFTTPQLTFQVPGNVAPVSRHTYNGPVYVPTLQKVLYPGGAMARNGNDYDTQDWYWDTPSRTYSAVPGSTAIRLRANVTGANMVYDSTRKRLLYLNSNVVYGIDVTGPGNPVTQLYNFNDGTALGSGTYIPSADWVLTIKDGAASTADLFYYDLSAVSGPYVRKTGLTFTGDPIVFNRGTFAMSHDPVANVTILWDSFDVVYELVKTGATTFSVTARNITSTSSLPASTQAYNPSFGSAQSGFGKAKFMPEYGAFVLGRSDPADGLIVYRALAATGSTVIPGAGAQPGTTIVAPGTALALSGGAPIVGGAQSPTVTAPGRLLSLALGNPVAGPNTGSIIPASTVGTGPITYGVVFKQGQQTQTSSLLGRQVDVKSLWSDGSVKHAIISDGVADGAPTLAALRASGWSFTITQTFSGVTYNTTDLHLTQVAPIQTWLNGPKCLEQVWLLIPGNGASSPSDTRIKVSLRMYAGNIAKLDLAFENCTWTPTVPIGDVTYDLQITVGGVQVVNKSAINHYHHARFRYQFWWPSTPTAQVNHDIDYLIATTALPPFDRSIVISNATLNSIIPSGTAFDILGSGGLSPGMSGVGGRPDIGPEHAWTAMWIVSGDSRAKQRMLANADLGGTWPVHFRDYQTKDSVSIDIHPYFSYNNGTQINPATGVDEQIRIGTSASPFAPDSAHQPHLAYVPYLITGDVYYRDEQVFWTTFNFAWRQPGYRGADGSGTIDPSRGIVVNRPWNFEVRANAWCLRTLVSTAWMLPDADGLKSYFNAKAIINATHLSNLVGTNGKTVYPALDATNPLRLTRLDLIATDIPGNYYETATWMEDWHFWAVQRAYELGYTQIGTFRDWQVQSLVGRYSATAWPDGVTYHNIIAPPGATPVSYTTWDQVITQTGSLFGRPPYAGGTAMLYGNADNQESYIANAYTGAAAAYDAGQTLPWTKIQSATNSRPPFELGPQFALVPRSLGTSPPPPPSIIPLSVTYSPNIFQPVTFSGTNGFGTVTISGAAGVGGQIITLTSSNPAVVVVPSTATVQAGATQATWLSQIVGPVSTVTTVIVTATANGASAQATLTVQPVTVSAVSGLSLTPNPIVGPGTVAGSVLLSNPAPAGGAVVTLNQTPAPSGVQATLTMPSTLTIAQGLSSGGFSITAPSVSANTAVTVQASYNGTANASLGINAAPPPPPPSYTVTAFTVVPASVSAGQTFTANVFINSVAGVSGVTVSIGATVPSAVSFPSTVTVAPNQNNASFTITALSVSADTQLTLSATVGGVTQSVPVTVLGPVAAAVASATINPASMPPGGSGVVTLNLAQASSQNTTATITVTPSSAVTAPATVNIPAGSTTVQFSITANAATTSTTFSMLVQIGSSSATATGAVIPATSPPPPPPPPSVSVASTDVRVLDIIKRSLRIIGALASGETPDADTAQDALGMLNDLMEQMSNEHLSVYNNVEYVHTLVPGKYQYSIGVGGDINVPRPLRITNVFVRVNGLDYPVDEIPLDQYAQIGLKQLNGPWPRTVYMNSGFPLAELFYWPNPSMAADVHIFVDMLMTKFGSLGDVVSIPEGYLMYLRWALACLLAPEYGKPVTPDMIQNRNMAKAVIRRTNENPQNVSGYDDVLKSGSTRSKSWILHGGFNK